MENERRSARRLAGPFDGGWNGQAGARKCRITDLSVGGCFIDSLSNSAMGSEVKVHFELAGERLDLLAEVVYVDTVQGFAVTFKDNAPEVMKTLVEMVDALYARPVSR
jgi:hypothetical protein